MSQRDERDEQRELKRAYRKAERTAAREQMVLDEASLTALIRHVEAALALQGCDESLRATRAWALLNAIAPDVLAASLAHFGGFCDCEVVGNVNPEELFDSR